MIQYYISMYETLSEDLLRIIVFILFNLTVLGVISLLGYVAFFFADSINTTILEADGIVVYKEFGDSKTPPDYIEDDYTLRIKHNGIVDEIQVSRMKYDKINMGDIVRVRFSFGRFTDSIYIDSIKITEPLTV